MRRIVLFLMLVSIAINVYTLHALYIQKKSSAVVKTTTLPDTYPLLARRIFLDNPNDTILNFLSLREKMHDYVGSKDSKLGVYFEYLPTGNSVGINEKEPFVAASLLKVPLIIAVYKEIERGNLTLGTKYATQQADIDSHFGNLWKEGIGREITVEEAIRLTLTESDNTANNVLFHALPPGSLEEVFDQMDIPKELSKNAAAVSPKNYSSILKSLYFSSILSREHSNTILNLLTKSKFKDKLPAGVTDKKIPVAHKIGVHSPLRPTESLYTDCGIVYVPKRQYILCIMDRADEKTAREHIRELSGMVYAAVATANK